MVRRNIGLALQDVARTSAKHERKTAGWEKTGYVSKGTPNTNGASLAIPLELGSMAKGGEVWG